MPKIYLLEALQNCYFFLQDTVVWAIFEANSIYQSWRLDRSCRATLKHLEQTTEVVNAIDRFIETHAQVVSSDLHSEWLSEPEIDEVKLTLTEMREWQDDLKRRVALFDQAKDLLELAMNAEPGELVDLVK